MTDYLFFPWVRSGLANYIDTVDDQSSALANRATFNARVSINEQLAEDIPERKLLVYGPGDVTGIDQRQVIRTEPVHLSADFEPNYFASIEFDRPDFPWMFTPAKSGNSDRLRPWICLVVVRKQEGVQVKYEPGAPLPVLIINDPADPAAELPDLSESWAWAHSQITGALNVNEIKDALQNQYERNLSRLICPRRLTAREGYFACVVPAFKAGVLAGLGLSSDDVGLDPAWDLAHLEKPVKLPVYYKWEFMAGAAGDFEALVWLLERKPLPEGIGQRPLKVMSLRNYGPPSTRPTRPPRPPRPVSLGGALRPISVEGMQAQEIIGTRPIFQRELLNLLNQGMTTRPWRLPARMPIPPPAYGRWHAAQTSIPLAERPPGPANRLWLRTLNLEVRNRVAAGLGTAVVQENQEQLMASAWEQLGEVEKANQLLRQAQLAREASYQIYLKHLINLPPEELASIAGPVLSRVMWGSETAFSKVDSSNLPVAALQGAFRRMTRPRGPLARRLGDHARSLTGRLIKGLADGSLQPVRSHPKPSGMFSDEEYQKEDFSNEFASLPKSLCDLKPESLLDQGLIRSGDGGEGVDQVRSAYKSFQITAFAVQYGMPPCDVKLEPPQRANLSLQDLKHVLINALDPRQTVQKRIKARVRLPPHWRPADELEPVMAAPVFPQAMYSELIKLSQDFMLPGIEKLTPDTIALLETNPEFIEAYMTGLNWEMARELLWRGFLTDQRGSYFRQFWDPAGSVEGTSHPEDSYDIKPLDQWPGTSPLGRNSSVQNGSSLAVLLIRGDLLRRYPRAVIYALKANWEMDENGNDVRRPVPIASDASPVANDYPEKYPIFQGKLPPDITFLGFPINSADLVGDDVDAGYFIVLQQQPTEPRFGLDETQQANLNSWDSLSWENVVTTPGGYIKLSAGLHLADDPNTEFLQPTTALENDIFWFNNANSAHLAYITTQKPLRVMVHASDLIGA